MVNTSVWSPAPILCGTQLQLPGNLMCLHTRVHIHICWPNMHTHKFFFKCLIKNQYPHLSWEVFMNSVWIRGSSQAHSLSKHGSYTKVGLLKAGRNPEVSHIFFSWRYMEKNEAASFTRRQLVKPIMKRLTVQWSALHSLLWHCSIEFWLFYWHHWTHDLHNSWQLWPAPH